MSILKVDTIQKADGTEFAQAGHFIQTQVGYRTAWTPTTSYALVSTGLAVTITPKFNTSQILITIGLNGIYTQEAAHYVRFHLYKGSSDLTGISTAHGQALASATNETEYATSLSAIYLDSPATTSSTTYSVYMGSSHSVSVGICNYGIGGNGSTRSTIMAQEIAQ
tara:strand:+ start:96 stop:593 length:498 start_codon:yes stop_codon:yes gene_type:complete